MNCFFYSYPPFCLYKSGFFCEWWRCKRKVLFFISQIIFAGLTSSLFVHFELQAIDTFSADGFVYTWTLWLIGCLSGIVDTFFLENTWLFSSADSNRFQRVQFVGLALFQIKQALILCTTVWNYKILLTMHSKSISELIELSWRQLFGLHKMWCKYLKGNNFFL